MKNFLLIGCLSGLMAAQGASAGLVLDAVTRQGERVTDRSRISVVPGRILIEVESGRKGVYQPALLYRAATEEIFVFDVEKRQYMTMSASRIQELARQMRGMLDMLPAELRQMTGSAGGSLPRIDAQKMETRRRIGEWKCEGYRILQNGNPALELWTVAFAEIGASEAEIRTYRNFMNRVLDLAAAVPNFADASDAALLGLGQVEGLPLQIRKLDGSGEITDVRFARRDLAASQFEPPAGYARAQFLIPGIDR